MGRNFDEFDDFSDGDGETGHSDGASHQKPGHSRDHEIVSSDEDTFFGEGRVVREVYGSARNIQSHGSPILRSKDEHIRYYFYPTWRSQFLNLCLFFVACIACVAISRMVPFLVVPGKLFGYGKTTVWLHFPVLVLIPGYVLGRILINVYDAKYVIDEGGVEAQVGLVSFNLRQPRLRWEDIRGSEPQQTLWERMLGIGSIGIGSAMKEDVEIVMLGVPNPRAIQLLIQGEREHRLNELRGGADVPTRGARVHAAMMDD